MANPEKWAIMYLHIRLSNLSFSSFDIWFWTCFGSVVFIFFILWSYIIILQITLFSNFSNSKEIETTENNFDEIMNTFIALLIIFKLIKHCYY